MFCTNCGSSIAQAHVFCTRCGTEVRQPSPASVAGPSVSPFAPEVPAPAAAPPPRVDTPAARPGLIKRVVTDQEANMCIAWAKGGSQKKLGLVTSILLMGFGIASSFGVVPPAAEIPIMIVLVPISLSMTLTSRIRQKLVSTAAKTAFAIDVTGVAKVKHLGSTVRITVGQVAFVFPRGHAPKLTRAAGTGESTLSCVVAQPRHGNPRGILTAVGGYMLDKPLPTNKVVGL